MSNVEDMAGCTDRMRAQADEEVRVLEIIMKQNVIDDFIHLGHYDKNEHKLARLDIDNHVDGFVKKNGMWKSYSLKISRIGILSFRCDEYDELEKIKTMIDNNFTYPSMIIHYNGKKITLISARFLMRIKDNFTIAHARNGGNYKFITLEELDKLYTKYKGGEPNA